MQDHASNSSHSSRRGSARTSTGEEHPVNPVVSISLSVEIAASCMFTSLASERFCMSVQMSVFETHRYISMVSDRSSAVSLYSIFLSFNSCFQPQLGYLQAGRRSETIKEDATMSTTTAEALHGHDPLFRYKVGFLAGIDGGQMYVYKLNMFNIDLKSSAILSFNFNTSL